MAQRQWTSQFSYSFERQPIRLMGNVTQSGSTGVFATKVTQGLTLTAVLMGSAGNTITIAFTGGATAGAEVVTVVGRAISVQIETGVSSITQVRTALNAAPAAAALVTTVGTSASAVVTASALPLLTGADTALTAVGLSGATVTQSGTGIWSIALADTYPNLLSISLCIQKASATDIKTQMISATMGYGVTNTIAFRTIAVATPTNLASGDVIYIAIELRNSSQTP